MGPRFRGDDDFIEAHPSPVIPAKAGIQGTKLQPPGHGIPAFAGMTTKVWDSYYRTQPTCHDRSRKHHTTNHQSQAPQARNHESPAPKAPQPVRLHHPTRSPRTP